MVTVRVADLWAAFNSFELRQLPILAQFKERYGVDLTPLERVSIVFPTPNEQPVEILRSERELPRKTVLRACLKEWTDEQIGEHVVHVGKDGRAVWFINDCGLVVGQRDRVLERVGSDAPETVGGLREVMAKAEREQVAVFLRGPMVQVSEVLKKHDLQSALFTLTCGKQIDLNLRLETGNDAGAAVVSKYTRGFVNLVRGQMLMLGGIQDAEGVFPEVGIEHLGTIPFELVRLAEKGLSQATLDTTGSTVTLSAALPIESRYLVQELVKVQEKMKARGMDPDEMFFGLSLHQSERLLSAPPPPAPTPARVITTQPIPTGPAVPMDSTIGLPYAPGGPRWEPPTSPHPFASAVTVPPTMTGPPVLQCTPPPYPVPVPPPSPAGVKWTVANLRREEVVLFEMGRDGKMTFRHKVSPGDAVDLTSPIQQRWVAFSPLGTTAESFEVKPEGVWLLRGPSVVATPAIPVTVQMVPPAPVSTSVIPVQMVPGPPIPR